MIKTFSKKLQKLLVLTLAITLLANTNAITVFADDTTSSVINYNSQIQLYDENNNIVAYYYELANKGYLITDATGSKFIEYSKEPNSSFLEQGKTYYYGGPLAYYEKSTTASNTLTDCKSEETVKKSSFDSTLEAPVIENGAKHANDCKAATAETIEPILKRGTVENKITYPTYPYDYNLTGTCGSVAAAIVLMYYHDYVAENYVPTQYVPSETSGQTLVSHLTNYIEGSSGSGSSYQSVESGLAQYFSEHSINATAKYVNPGTGSSKTIAQIKSVVDNNKPCMVGITGHPTYQEHWVVGTGYSTDGSVTADSSTTDDSSSSDSSWGDDSSSSDSSWGDDSSSSDSSWGDDSSSSDSSWGDDSSSPDSSWGDDSSSPDSSWGDDSSGSDSSWGDDSSDSSSLWADDSSDSGSILGGVTDWFSGLFSGSDSSSDDSSCSDSSSGILDGLSNFSSLNKFGSSLSGIFNNLFNSSPSDQTTYSSSNNLGSSNTKMTGGSDNSQVESNQTATATDNSLKQDDPADASATGTTTENVKYGASSVIVNDGWGSQNVNINLEYVDGCVYLQ